MHHNQRRSTLLSQQDFLLFSESDYLRSTDALAWCTLCQDIPKSRTTTFRDEEAIQNESIYL